MATRKNGKPRRSKNQKDKDLKEVYAKIRREFSAADLQKYTEIEVGVPLEEVIAEMEEIHRQVVREKRKKK